MTNETRERIKYYQDLLPSLKEKVVAAALMRACLQRRIRYLYV